MKRLLLSLLLLVTCTFSRAQAYVSTAEDVALGELILSELSGNRTATAGERMVLAAKCLLGQRYVAATQEGREEKLRIYLTRTDCILFAETCLGLARTSGEGPDGATFEALAAAIGRTRYSAERIREGFRPYATRVHYVTEWISRGEAEGYFRDITQELGGVPDTRRIDYMSAHPDSYAPLTGESRYAKDNLADIVRMEEAVNRIPRQYVPKEEIAAVEDRIRDGDILCFATSVDGLDYTHVGIAYREKPGAPLTFIHASSAAGKVIVEPRSLADYLQGRRSAVGVTVLRVND